MFLFLPFYVRADACTSRTLKHKSVRLYLSLHLHQRADAWMVVAILSIYWSRFSASRCSTLSPRSPTWRRYPPSFPILSNHARLRSTYTLDARITERDVNAPVRIDPSLSLSLSLSKAYTVLTMIYRWAYAYIYARCRCPLSLPRRYSSGSQVHTTTVSDSGHHITTQPSESPQIMAVFPHTSR